MSSDESQIIVPRYVLHTRYDILALNRRCTCNIIFMASRPYAKIKRRAVVIDVNDGMKCPSFIMLSLASPSCGNVNLANGSCCSFLFKHINLPRHAHHHTLPHPLSMKMSDWSFTSISANLTVRVLLDVLSDHRNHKEIHRLIRVLHV